MWSLVASLALAGAANAQVTATFPNGDTNPAAPEFLPIGAQVNQTSMSRLLSLNGIDDFCLYGPPEEGPDSLIGNVEPIVVAYCTKPRNQARLIPDGAIHSAHLIKTPLYVQISGMWDGTTVNIPAGDTGGELDPHGAENKGNPVGGNVTTNLATGRDIFYEEWMSFISFDQFCLRICTAEDPANGVTAALQCEHELDIMGCRFVMAIEDHFRSNGTFTECDGEPAAPPGLYPLPGGGTSTFRQRYTGTWTNSANRETGVFTVGRTVTPSAPAFWPKTSNCFTYSTISNGVDMANLMVTAAPTVLAKGSSSVVTGIASTSQAVVTTPTKVPTKPAQQSSGSATAPATDSAGRTTGSVAAPAASASTTGSGASALVVPALAAVGAAAVGVLAVF
ncbi:hypothetical protein CC85DRAFT_285338 [Cutaneotrichosporon oleaginosum]|uniref:Glycoprotein n=1 Tax=Cutaneotrichosporon oleaginosum TaxID=879819 RepID=A0A0J0XN95_9TREE|nr:uncharacterized protein CC85DRAFT_285338 [Cutaneotrichosporon oleaginosum]KLT42606.1 hypothetical protein CC85DRAFT_285338 [Cutaneotrichosporon oleaginosum]TXT05277.1 hypothetical protein COLE_06597 [Cutaneotrichosporon oleaginosum]